MSNQRTVTNSGCPPPTEIINRWKVSLKSKQKCCLHGCIFTTKKNALGRGDTGGKVKKMKKRKMSTAAILPVTVRRSGTGPPFSIFPSYFWIPNCIKPVSHDCRTVYLFFIWNIRTNITTEASSTILIGLKKYSFTSIDFLVANLRNILLRYRFIFSFLFISNYQFRFKNNFTEKHEYSEF